MEAAKRLDGIGEYYFSTKLKEIEKLNKEGKQIINLGIGSPDQPPHPSVIQKMAEAAAVTTSHGYQSYVGAPALRQAMAAWYQDNYSVALNPDNEILPLIGSKEGIMHICMAFLNEGDKVLVPNPGYPTYRSAVKMAGSICVDYALTGENNFQIDWLELEELAAQRPKMMFLNYPHMPTGTRPAEGLFEKLVAFAKEHHILLVHDNPYSFILNDQPQSILKVPGAKAVAVELNSLSKSHNMAGWRIGMLVGDAEKITQVLRFKSNMDSGMFLPLQLAATAALQLGREWTDSVNATYAARREYAIKLLNLLECAISPEQSGLFLWAKVPVKYKDGYELSDKILYDANVFITPGGIFGSNGNEYVRVSLCCTEEKFQESVNRVKQVL